MVRYGFQKKDDTLFLLDEADDASKSTSIKEKSKKISIVKQKGKIYIYHKGYNDYSLNLYLTISNKKKLLIFYFTEQALHLCFKIPLKRKFEGWTSRTFD